SASTSLVILAVSIRHSVWPRVKLSPSRTIHSAMVPSVISMPHLGMVKARILLMAAPPSPIVQRLADGGGDPGRARQISAFQLAGERHRRMRRGHHLDRRAQAGEGLARD